MISLLLAVATALAWAFVAIYYGNAPKEVGGFRRFSLISNSVYLLLSLPNISLTAVDIHDFLRLAAYIAPSSVLECLGFLLLKFAMSSGNPGIAWCLGQSAMVVPFVGGLLFLDGQCSLVQGVGVALLVATMVILGSVKNDASAAPADAKGAVPSAGAGSHCRFLAFAGSAFICIGMALYLRSVPSPENFSEAVLGWRLPMVSFIPLVFFMCMSASGAEKYPFKTLLRNGAIDGIFVALGQKLCLWALDAGAADGLAPMVFPVAMGGSVLLYNLYCAFWLKERFTPLAWTGIATALVGMFAIMMK